MGTQDSSQLYHRELRSQIFFLRKFSQMWVGGVLIPKQDPNPSKCPRITPKISNVSTFSTVSTVNCLNCLNCHNCLNFLNCLNCPNCLLPQLSQLSQLF